MSKPAARRSAIARQLNKRGIESMVREISSRTAGGVAVHSVRVNDGYEAWHYKPQRAVFYSTAAVMNRYLAKRPDLPFAHRRNLARHFLYGLPSFSKWAELMDSQGSLAMEPLHDPEVKRLASGHRLGPVTRRLFRHGSDPRGIRTRTVVAGWLASAYVKKSKNAAAIKWLSLAGGSAVHAMHMIDASGAEKALLRYADIDANPFAIELAAAEAQKTGLSPHNTHMLVGDIFDAQLIEEAGFSSGVDIIDMMGILEYLDDRQAGHLVRSAYEKLSQGGIILTCNMRKSHPQLHLNQRGVGWPGVIPRSTEELVNLFKGCGIDAADVDVYQPGDGVYNIVRIIKRRNRI